MLLLPAMHSMPQGASHRIRVWLKIHVPLSEPLSPSSTYSIPFVDSFVYQRVWKSDSFKLGAQLDYSSLGPTMAMGVSTGAAKTVYLSGSGERLDSKEVLVEVLEPVEIG